MFISSRLSINATTIFGNSQELLTQTCDLALSSAHQRFSLRSGFPVLNRTGGTIGLLALTIRHASARYTFLHRLRPGGRHLANYGAVRRRVSLPRRPLPVCA